MQPVWLSWSDSIAENESWQWSRVSLCLWMRTRGSSGAESWCGRGTLLMSQQPCKFPKLGLPFHRQPKWRVRCVCPLIIEVLLLLKRPQCQPKEETSACEFCEWLCCAAKQQPQDFCAEIPLKVPNFSQGFLRTLYWNLWPWSFGSLFNH